MKINNSSDNIYFIGSCFHDALQSPDPRTQTGAALVSPDGGVIGGYNGFFNGIKITEERLHNQELKYIYITHAERCVIGLAARHGRPTAGSTLYATWIICPDCANSVIMAGIKRVVGYKPLLDLSPEYWASKIKHSFTMLEEAGVVVELVDVPINAEPIRFSGRMFCPRTIALT